MSASEPRRVSNVSSALAQNRLGVADIVFFNMSAAAPLVVVAGLIPTGFAITEITGIPVAYVAVAVVLALFAVGFVAMARQVANAGAFYSYVSHGLGRPLGVGAAWVALLAYNALQVGLYGIVGAATAPLLQQWFGIEVPWYVIALTAWALVAVLGLMRVDLNGKVLAVLLLSEIVVITVFSAAGLLNPADGVVSVDTLSPANLVAPGLGALLVLAVLGFVGFENSVVFSEESRNRNHTVMYATFISIALIGGLYTLASWAMTVSTGPDGIVAAAQESGPELLFVLAAENLGPVVADVGNTLFATSLLAGMISFHNTTSRYVFALGREGVLPRGFGRTNALGAPRAGSLAQSVLGLSVIATYALAGLDPVTQLFFWAGTSGGLGVLLLIAVTSVAIVVYFTRQGHDGHPLTRVVVPSLAALLMIGVAYLAVTNFSTVLGPAPQILPVLIPVIYLAAVLLGVGYALVLKATGSPVYDRIGLGARSALAGIAGSGQQPVGAMAGAPPAGDGVPPGGQPGGEQPGWRP